MEHSAIGLDQLPEQLRSALLDFLDADEVILWVGRPAKWTPRNARDLFGELFSRLLVRLLCIGPIIVGLGGIYEAIRLWVPGATLPMLVQVAAFGFVTIVGVCFVYAASRMRAAAGDDLERTVYAVTCTRVLGFIGDPTEAYHSWYTWHGEAKIKTRNIRADGSGDVLFPGLMTRGHAFEGDTVFTRIRDAETVASLVEDAISQAATAS